jgi:esterase/lipase superfamily enzyme
MVRHLGQDRAVYLSDAIFDLKVARFLVVTAVAAAALGGGCSERPREGVLIPTAAAISGTSRVRVLAVTTRQRSSDPGEMFNGDRSEQVSYASVVVSIPPSRKIGDVQWPVSPPGDPSRNFVTVSADFLGQKSFVSALAAEAEQTKRRKVLVFVHGFNNRFDDAVYRFAQIVHDSKAQALPVLFTWPSRGQLRLRSYTYDRESANFSRDALEGLLDTLARQPNISEVTIMAHSMGNWVTLEALRTRSIRTAGKPDKIKNVLLVAPDVDIDVFRTQIRRIGTANLRFALFVSQDDRALSLSRTIWGDMPRLGDVNPEQEPYRSEFAKDHIEVFDLAKVKSAGDDAHSRAFQKADSVMAMIRERLIEGQMMQEVGDDNPLGIQLTDFGPPAGR